jgi:creatinine amidohydrolase
MSVLRLSRTMKFAAVMVVASSAILSGLSRPLTAPLPTTTAMAEMTWVEVRTAIQHGYDTVLVPSGGIEQSGPHMILDKHQHIVGLTSRLIAEAHGRMLVAPVISLVPQGAYAPASGNMIYPGTIGVTEEVFAGMLDGVARSLKSAGFRRIVFIADHGQSQKTQAGVAARLTREWAQSGTSVIALGDYYSKGDAAQRALLVARGETPASIGDHAGMQDTAELMFAHGAGVKPQRLGTLTLEADGASGQPDRASAELGKLLIDLKVKAALAQLAAPNS